MGKALATAPARLEEMEVELAWLADDATFPCLLHAKVHGPALEVTGTVPSEAVKMRVLQIAKQTATLAIKELVSLPKGSRAIVSICADGGLGTVALLEH